MLFFQIFGLSLDESLFKQVTQHLATIDATHFRLLAFLLLCPQSFQLSVYTLNGCKIKVNCIKLFN